MLLGKRPRPPMKRTTSMKEITFDLKPCNESEPSDFDQMTNPFTGFVDQRFLSMVSPRSGNLRRHSGDFSTDATHFLRACFLCKRTLVPGRDIYMYRGDSAFCSSDCRQLQIHQDEKTEKCKVKESRAASATSSAAATAAGETVPAV